MSTKREPTNPTRSGAAADAPRVDADAASAPEGPGDPGRLIQRLDRLAWLLDSSVRVPLTGLRVGIDGLIGLIPIVGDAASAGLSLYLIAEARRFGLPKPVQIRMLGNMLVDAGLGAIPIVGDLFDFGFKANRRNVALLRRFLGEQSAPPGQ